MWNRAELKAKGKAAFKRNYWNCVLAALLVMIVTVAFSSSATTNSDSADVTRVSLSIGGSALVMLVGILARNPFSVGVAKFFADNSAENAPLNDLVSGFTTSYVRNVLALLLRDVFIVLWTLLFIVPGIVKAYAYRMVPYILADDPTIEAKAAIDLSSQMMNGHKWSAFVLDLSFLGWYLLNLLTCGLLGLFYVNPYVSATDAELYHTLKNKQ